MKKVPSFFSFIGKDVNMNIPIAFTQRMKKPFPEKVFLRDRHNNLWIVKVEKVGECWCFVDGWDTFVDDNLITPRDLLVFYCFHENLFYFKLFGICGTEKNLTRPSMVRGVKTCMKLSENEESDDDDDDYEEEDMDYDDEYDFDEITEPENKDHLSIDRDNEDEEDGVAPHQYLYSKCYGMEIFEAGLAERPINPYFVAKLMPKRKQNLFIPRDTIHDYNLTIADEIILVDPAGREFLAKYIKWKDGRISVAREWVSLCKVNSVEENDKCICEFVQREGDQRQFLHISFV